jgi:hypothetical protein
MDRVASLRAGYTIAMDSSKANATYKTTLLDVLKDFLKQPSSKVVFPLGQAGWKLLHYCAIGNISSGSVYLRNKNPSDFTLWGTDSNSQKDSGFPQKTLDALLFKNIDVLKVAAAKDPLCTWKDGHADYDMPNWVHIRVETTVTLEEKPEVPIELDAIFVVNVSKTIFKDKYATPGEDDLTGAGFMVEETTEIPMDGPVE